MGGHLATITSAQEQDFVSGRIAVEVWIGATDSQKETTFVWITGEPFEYQAFIPGEIDNPGAAVYSDCAVYGLDRLWHDRVCAKRHKYLCEVD